MPRIQNQTQSTRIANFLGFLPKGAINTHSPSQNNKLSVMARVGGRYTRERENQSSLFCNFFPWRVKIYAKVTMVPLASKLPVVDLF